MKTRYFFHSKVNFILLLSLIFTCFACQDDVEFERSSGVNNSYTLYLKSEGGTETFSIKSNSEWSVKLDEASQSWLTLDGPSSGSGDQDIKITYEQNRDFNRQGIALISMSGINIVDTLYLNQHGKAVVLKFQEEEIKNPATEGDFALDFLTNLDEKLMSNIKIRAINEEGENSDWVQELNFIEGQKTVIGKISANPTTNDRTTKLQISYPDGWGGIVAATCNIHQIKRGGSNNTKSITFEELKAMISAAEGEIKIESDISISGYVISDYKNTNVAANTHTSQTTIDYDVNYRTAYLQNQAGTSGIAIRTTTKEENKLSRYDQFDLWLEGLTLKKESNPTRYTIEGVTFANYIKKTAGTANDVVVKEKYIDELNDNDIYTFVKLKECEFPIKKGSFTPINEGYGSAYNVYRVDMYPLLVSDSKGGFTHLMTNLSCDYRRDGNTVPFGSGSISGVIVHEKYERFEKDGFISKYQIRALSREEIALDKESSNSNTKLLCEWTKFTTGSNKGQLAQTGTGKLWQTFTAGNLYAVADFDLLTPTDGNKGVTVSGSHTAIAKTEWWRDSEAQSWVIEFDTKGINTSLLTLNLATYNPNIGAPRYWIVETSTHGDMDGTWDKVDEYTVPDVVQWGNTLYTQMSGWKNIGFTLNPSLLNGSDKAYIRLKMAGNKAGTASDYDNGTIVATAANAICYLSIRYK